MCVSQTVESAAFSLVMNHSAMMSDVEAGELFSLCHAAAPTAAARPC